MLSRLLSDTRRYHVAYGDGLGNHLPMILIALDRLGATPTRLTGFARRYVPRLRNVEPAEAGIAAANWRNRLGERAAFPALLRFFDAEVARLGWRAALWRYLPPLVPGLAAGGLLAMIRTGFGVAANQDSEIAIGLAHWTSYHQPLLFEDDEGDVPLTGDPVAALAALRDAADLELDKDAESSLDREMILAARLEGFAGAVGGVRVAHPDRLLPAAAALYLASGKINSLQAVIALHAARLLVPYLEDPAPLARALWAALAAVYVAIGRPALPDAAALDALREVELPDWKPILASALEAEDEHHIALVFSAVELGRATGDRLWRALAAQAVGLEAERDAG